MEKLKILLADDLLQSRDDFMFYWNTYFSKTYNAEITECETAQEALYELEKTRDTKKYYDIVLSDIDFSENQMHEGREIGFEIIKKAKEINFKTVTIWYSSQSYENAKRFDLEEELKRTGFIDYSLKKAFMGDHFKKILSMSIDTLKKEKANLVIFLSKLFDTYNFGEDENHDLGFYKLTHANYDRAEKLRVLPKAKNYYDESPLKSFLFPESIEVIDKYLLNLESTDPLPEEMEYFKSYFRLELTDDVIKSCQQPLVNNNVNINNIFESNTVSRIYCEKERLLLGLKTIYENIAKHNFSGIADSPVVTTVISQEDDVITFTITANGNSFNPKEKFLKNKTSGLSAISKCFNKCCSVIYEGCGVSFNIFTSESSESEISTGIKIVISIQIPLPTLSIPKGMIEDV